MKRPKAPEPTAQELAGVARQSRMIDEETEEMEKRLKAAARGKLGSKSLLAKATKKTSGGGTRHSVWRWRLVLVLLVVEVVVWLVAAVILAPRSMIGPVSKK